MANEKPSSAGNDTPGNSTSIPGAVITNPQSAQAARNADLRNGNGNGLTVDLIAVVRVGAGELAFGGQENGGGRVGSFEAGGGGMVVELRATATARLGGGVITFGGHENGGRGVGSGEGESEYAPQPALAAAKIPPGQQDVSDDFTPDSQANGGGADAATAATGLKDVAEGGGKPAASGYARRKK